MAAAAARRGGAARGRVAHTGSEIHEEILKTRVQQAVHYKHFMYMAVYAESIEIFKTEVARCLLGQDIKGYGANAVCIGFLDKFYKYLQAQDVEFTPEYIETELILMCENTRGKENRLCYYIGGTSDAATRIINEVVRPLSAHVPVTNICEKLKKKDSQICELRYDKVLDLNRAKLSTMRVADLKRILDNWSEVCRACAEKSEFVDLILALAPKYSSDFIDPKDDL